MEGERERERGMEGERERSVKDGGGERERSVSKRR